MMITTDRVELCAAADVDEGDILKIDDVPGFTAPLAVVHSGGTYYCIDDTCSHQDASLSDGWVDEGCVECPLHESRFDLCSGKPDIPPAREPIRTYPVEVVDGIVYLRREEQ
jgi:3-phenylpropionate/trans-cinnamate dioxygenase ferredoxin subunit